MSLNAPTNLASFENIIFDLGGVIIDVDYNLTAKEFSKLAGHDVSHVYNKKTQVNFFDKFETGKITCDEFHHELRTLLQLPDVSDEELDFAWNAMVLNLPSERINILRSLREHKKIFLCSNTNAIHEILITKALASFGMKSFDEIFHGVVYSHHVGMRKPHKEIFDYMIQKYKLNPERTAFIDDSPQHVVGASTCGIHAFHLDHGHHIGQIRFS